MQKILCPVDFTPTSLNALEYAKLLGAALKSTLTIVYVLSEEELNKVIVESESSFEDWKHEAEARLKVLIQQVSQDPNANGLLKCDYTIKVGELTESVVDLSEEGNFKLIVMGTGGASDLKKVYWGSNTIKVVGKSSVPVLCVPIRAQFNKAAKLVYATNMDDQDRETIAQLQTIAMAIDATMEVVNVVDKSKVKKDDFKSFELKIRTFVPFNKLHFKQIESDDRVSLVLDRYMQQENACFLSLLTHERNFFERLLHQSVTKDISGFTDYPLLIFKK